MPAGFPFWTNAPTAVSFTVDGVANAGKERVTTSSLHLTELLSCDVANPEECWEDVLLSNYMTDFPWLLQTLPQLLECTGQIVVLSGEKGTATVTVGSSGAKYRRSATERDVINPILSSAHAAGLRRGANAVEKVAVIEPPLPFPWGTHHTKMCLAVNERGLRVAIFTANFVHADWHHKAQGMYIQDFPRRRSDSIAAPKGIDFARELGIYLHHCGLLRANGTADKLVASLGCFGQVTFLEAFDFSTAKVSLVASVPGSHVVTAPHSFGLNRLAKLVNAVDPGESVHSQQQLTWQYSSQGVLHDRFLHELQQAMTLRGCDIGEVRVVYPTEDEVRHSVEGWRGGLSLPLRVKSCHAFINARLHRWGTVDSKSTHCACATGQTTRRKRPRPEAETAVIDVDDDVSSGETHDGVSTPKEPFVLQFQPEALGTAELWRYALPHIKTYAASFRGTLSWFLLTSANLSQAAWGTSSIPSSKQQRLFIRSYELGVFYDATSSVALDATGRPEPTQWHCVTPSNPLPFPSAQNSPHLHAVPFDKRNAGNPGPEATLFLPFDVLTPVAYASTAALRVAEGGTQGQQPVSRRDVPWVIDMPHSGLDSLGHTLDDALDGYSFYGEESWCAPVQQRGVERGN